uniref:Hcy-binding domain-containing protein n=2 Tax=Ditylum brightwellii TaxID=49249 RepID=A0A7S4R824_9STRA|mmetsp:Transcript_41912/g.63304  ORF Transcript_41912/g.63304 Transcript_41912/m.63304 type:complete len:378 (+) Transcript_41912:36-1169(+)
MKHSLLFITLATSTRKNYSRIATTGMSFSSAKGMHPLSDAIQKHFDRLRSNKRELLLLDGGTGEELFRRGVPDDRKIWSATAVVNEQYHQVLIDVHRSFVNAGSDAITSNSYSITPGVGFSYDSIAKHVATAGKIARESLSSGSEDCDATSRKTSPHAGGPLVFGSLGPLVESYRPDKIMEHMDGIKVYSMMTKSLSPFVDCFLAETMSSFEESSQAVEAVGNLSLDYQRPLIVSYTLHGDGSVRSGESVTRAIQRLLDFATLQKVQLLGVMFNCAEPEAITRAFEQIHSNDKVRNLLDDKGIILGAYANRLTSIYSDWTLEGSEEAQPMRKDLSPQQYFDEFISTWVRDLGVQMVGGCCGITPEHISYMHSHLFLD